MRGVRRSGELGGSWGVGREGGEGGGGGSGAGGGGGGAAAAAAEQQRRGQGAVTSRKGVG